MSFVKVNTGALHVPIIQKNKLQKVSMSMEDLDDISRRMVAIQFDFEQDGSLGGILAAPKCLLDGVVEDQQPAVQPPTEVIALM